MNRVALVAFALASCGPRWSLDGRTDPRDVVLEPGTAAAAVIAIEASHPIATVRTVAERISARSGTIRIEQHDAREGCSTDATVEGHDGSWGSTLTADRINVSASCGATEHATKIDLRITNQGREAVSFAWHVVATTNGDGSSEPPDDAFIRVRVE